MSTTHQVYCCWTNLPSIHPTEEDHPAMAIVVDGCDTTAVTPNESREPCQDPRNERFHRCDPSNLVELLFSLSSSVADCSRSSVAIEYWCERCRWMGVSWSKKETRHTTIIRSCRQNCQRRIQAGFVGNRRNCRRDTATVKGNDTREREDRLCGGTKGSKVSKDGCRQVGMWR